MVNGKLLDLVALLETMTKRGGVRRVQDKNLWKEVSPTSGLWRQPFLVYGVEAMCCRGW